MLKTILYILINILKSNVRINNMMTGWKTWVAGLGAIIYGAVLIIGGHTEQGITLILSGLAALGIGHKIEKASK